MYNMISRLCELHCNYTFHMKKDNKLLSSDLNVLSSVPWIILRWYLIVQVKGVQRRTVGATGLSTLWAEFIFIVKWLKMNSATKFQWGMYCKSWVQSISCFLSTLFYVFLFQCSQGCDYCRDPDAVDELVEHWRRGAMAGAYRSVSAGRTYIACDTSSGDDTELYEGGKFAYRRE